MKNHFKRLMSFAMISAAIGSSLVGCGSTDSVSAQAVIDAFASRGLPVVNDRDNSENCDDLGCDQMITTDNITVISWSNSDDQKHFADEFGSNAFSTGSITLSFAAARTPAAAQAKYERVLSDLLH